MSAHADYFFLVCFGRISEQLDGFDDRADELVSSEMEVNKIGWHIIQFLIFSRCFR